MKRPPDWLAWLVVLAVAAVSAYLKFDRDASAWVYGPVMAVTVVLAVVVLGHEGDDGADTLAEPDEPQK